MELKLDIYDTTQGCAATVYDGKTPLDESGIARVGILRWYKGGQLIATGAECKCAAGETVECKLEA